MASNTKLLDPVRALLDEGRVPHRLLHHAAAHTTQEFASARNAPVSLGVKALLLKVQGEWVVIALRAHQRLDNRVLRKALGAQKLRFASREELTAHRLAPGQIPPLGQPVLPFRLIADTRVLAEPQLAFTAGTHTDSIIMATTDWQRVAQPQLLPLSGAIADQAATPTA